MFKLKSENGHWSKASKVTGTIAAVLSVGATMFQFYNLNTWDSELDKFKEQQLEKECREISSRLHLISSKERTEGLTEFEEQYQDQLISNKERTCSS